MDDALLDRFLAALAAKGLSPGTVRLRRERLVPAFRHFRAHGILTPAMLMPEDIDAFMVHLVEKDLRRETRKSYQTSLRVFGRWIADQGLVLVDPTVDLAPLSTEEAEELPPQPLTVTEAGTLLASIPLESVKGYRNRAVTELLYQCGLRLGEAVGLDLSDLDLDAEIVTVRGKGGQQRTLPLLPGVILALRDYLARRRELLQGPDRGPLFLGEDGERLRNTAYRQWLIRHGGVMLGRDRMIFPHLLRHSCAVHLLMGGADIRHVQELLGHADINTTRIYLRLLPDELRAQYEAAMPKLLA